MEQELSVASAAFIGAASALAGVVVSQVGAALQGFAERKHQRRVMLRGKYEELMRTLNEAMEWVTLSLAANTFPELRARSNPIPARWVYSLSLLYFSELTAAAGQLLSASIAFQHVLIESYTETEPGTAGAKAVRRDQRQLEAAHRSIVEARLELDDLIQKHARKYARA